MTPAHLLYMPEISDLDTKRFRVNWVIELLYLPNKKQTKNLKNPETKITRTDMLCISSDIKRHSKNWLRLKSVEQHLISNQMFASIAGKEKKKK